MPMSSASGSVTRRPSASGSPVIGIDGFAMAQRYLAGDGVGGVGVDLVGLDGVVDDRSVDDALRGEGRQHRDLNVGGVGLEEPAERLAGVGAAEAVGAEGHEALGYE